MVYNKKKNLMYVYDSQDYHLVSSFMDKKKIEHTLKSSLFEVNDSLFSKLSQCIPFVKNWDNLCIAGGSVLSHLRSTACNDVDFYIYGIKDSEEYEKKVLDFISWFDVDYVNTPFTIS